MDASGSPLGYVILAVFLLLLLSAFFSGAETALFAVNRLRMRRMAEEGRRRPALILRLLEQPGRVLTALLVGNNIANVTASVLATALLVAVLGPQLGPIYAIIILTLVILIIGEITPKTFAAKYADRLAILVSRPVHYFTVALTPVIWLLSRLSDLLVRPLGGRVNLASPLVTEEEIRLLVKMGEEVGVLQEEERQMIHSIFEFGDTVAREVMVPRIDMICIEDSASLDDILRVILEEGHSRLPVYHESIDRIVGVIYVKDLLSHLKAGHSTLQAKEVMRPAYFIPETKRLDDLFREMRRKKTPMAIVVDEYGGTAGLVTTEDLLEEIVGPILDEYDVEEKLVEIVNDQVALVDGRLSLEEVNELLNLDLPVGEVDTIGGFVYALLGRAPTQGESVRADSVEMQVERLDGQRIARVKITRLVPSQPLRP
ncbi:MAG: HlyC/CorC family transporter [Armatimonadetes bacterium]|nr:HlyC/CorC family transporter [Armatimonadota bacterium]MBI2972778.1 HlyC/CorC family transporter [Armatimonadota bacterium]